jgi:CRISPR-associated protein Csx10
LGGSRSGGYGRVNISKVQQHPGWLETGAMPTKISAGNTFALTLLSDLVIRDENGQPTDTLCPARVAQAFNVPVQAVEFTGRAFKQTTLVGGFNRKWGLPMPQTIAVRAGSVIEFKTNTDIPASAAAKLLEQGIGERRAEGFGRVAVNWPDIPALTVEIYQEDTRRSMNLPDLSNPASQKLAKQMNRRLLRRDADLKLAKTVNDLSLRPAPTRSQLGGLRVIIRSALAQHTVQPVLDYLNQMRSAAGNQFGKAKLIHKGDSKEEFLSWLKNTLQESAKIWNVIGFNPPKFIGKDPQQPDAELGVEYTLRLIDGILAKAAKEKEGETR